MTKPDLPGVIVIGAMKAGTTSLYEYMAGHRDIGVSREKETDFFIAEKNWHRGLGWYQGLFPAGCRVLAEASPNYTKRGVFGGVPERIREVLPDCKFIFISRDPVQRAESQYRHAVLSGAGVPPVAQLPGSAAFDHLVDTSSYAAQLAPYLALFPRGRFLFLDFSELAATPAAALSKVADFLGVEDRWPAPEEIETNSAAALARLPLWLFRWRETRLASVLKALLPRGALNRMKALLSRSAAPRQAETFPEPLKAELARRLDADRAAFDAIRSGAAAP